MEMATGWVGVQGASFGMVVLSWIAVMGVRFKEGGGRAHNPRGAQDRG